MTADEVETRLREMGFAGHVWRDRRASGVHLKACGPGEEGTACRWADWCAKQGLETYESRHVTVIVPEAPPA